MRLNSILMICFYNACLQVTTCVIFYRLNHIAAVIESVTATALNGGRRSMSLCSQVQLPFAREGQTRRGVWMAVELASDNTGVRSSGIMDLAVQFSEPRAVDAL